MRPGASFVVSEGEVILHRKNRVGILSGYLRAQSSAVSCHLHILELLGLVRMAIEKANGEGARSAGPRRNKKSNRKALAPLKTAGGHMLYRNRRSLRFIVQCAQNPVRRFV